MWGIEFYDDAEKSRSSTKVSPKTTDLISHDKQEEKGGGEGPWDVQSYSHSSTTKEDKASTNLSTPIKRTVIFPEEAQPQTVHVNEEINEEKIGDHQTTPPESTDGMNKQHVTPNLRDESIDEGYVLVGHKEKYENQDLNQPGIVTHANTVKSHWNLWCISSDNKPSSSVAIVVVFYAFDNLFTS